MLYVPNAIAVSAEAGRDAYVWLSTLARERGGGQLRQVPALLTDLSALQRARAPAAAGVVFLFVFFLVAVCLCLGLRFRFRCTLFFFLS